MSITLSAHSSDFVVRLAALAALVLGAGFVAPSPAQAANFTVNTTADELNNDGDCSLREAIRAANKNLKVDACPAGSSSSTDTITVPAGTYTLKIVGSNEDDAAAGDLDLRGKLTIKGAGAGKTIIDGNKLERIFDIRGGAYVTLSGVTVRNAGLVEGSVRNVGTLTVNNSTIKDNITEHRGGGIWNSNIMTVNNSTISANYAFSGGGVYNSGTLTLSNTTISGNSGYPWGGGIWNSGTLNIKNRSVIRDNECVGDGEGEGGGVYNVGGKVTISNSTVSQNLADYGGGIYNDSGSITADNVSISRNMVTGVGTNLRGQVPDGSGGGMLNFGTLTLNNATVSSNTYKWEPSNSGGGVANFGQATITSSTISRNKTANHGGGIYNGGTLSLYKSTVKENNAGELESEGTIYGRAGGIYNVGTLTIKSSAIRDNIGWDGTGGILNDKSLTVIASTISGNQGKDYGGGIDNSGTATFTASTISGNSGYDGGGIANYGAATLLNVTVSGNIVFDTGPGILNKEGASTLTIASSTIVGNRNRYADDGVAGAGLVNRGSSVQLRNSILATGTGNIPGGDCEGTIISQGYNLIQSPGCTLSGTTTGNQLNIDPKLGPLQNNGGPSWTYALLSDSPAIDAANPATPGSGGNACASTDQRGYKRPQDGNGDGSKRCDIGAYERQTSSSYSSAWGESDIEQAPDPASLPDPRTIPDELVPEPAQIEPVS